jgi:hypothetical protein
MVPADDEHSTRFTLYVMKPEQRGGQKHRFVGQFEKYGSTTPRSTTTSCSPAQGPPEEGFVIGLISAQDYIAQKGQGIIADRSLELLGKSDLGVVTLAPHLLARAGAIARGGRPSSGASAPAARCRPTTQEAKSGETEEQPRRQNLQNRRRDRRQTDDKTFPGAPRPCCSQPAGIACASPQPGRRRPPQTTRASPSG